MSLVMLFDSLTQDERRGRAPGPAFPRPPRPGAAGLHHPDSAGGGRGAAEQADQDLQVNGTEDRLALAPRGLTSDHS